ncbi:MAG: transmembrane 220 family protein [Maribacter sp.]
MELLFKFLGWVFLVLFSTAALLQYNDPDALVWIIIYTSAALVMLGFLFNKVSYIVPLFVGLMGFFGFVYQFPARFEGFDINKGDKQNVEEGREAFGLLIMAIVMLIFSARIRWRKTLKV